ncbi:MAG: hypothetical protein LBV52_07065, partial [Spirochaetaceae bacterium]|nr:hypothetical protein [Spirochaetaceae bacterium]
MRFKYLSAMPEIDYKLMREKENGKLDISEFRFTGGFDSITEDGIMWVRSDEPSCLSVPVILKNAQTFILPLTEKLTTAIAMENGADNNELTESILDKISTGIQRVKFSKISSLASGAKVFIAGKLCKINGRHAFCSSRQDPLIIIFYECSETTLSNAVLCAGRTKTDNINRLTPYSLIAGVFFMVYIV